jgi:phage terminase large subunit
LTKKFSINENVRLQLPYNWKPRAYQLPLWSYLNRGGKRAVNVWHRRAGKDDVALRWACVQAYKRVGNYWHMLPEASQARKAIWDAINRRTGMRRIDEAFPLALRETTRENEMLIKFHNGSTWQVVGSDNYNSLVGSAPVGVVFSEFALAQPAAWAYIRPILRENDGWAIFIYTPRGKNHGWYLYQSALKSEDWFAEKLTVDQTGVFTPEELATELAELQREYGPEQGRSFWEQEYFCSFEAAILGAVYGAWILQAERAGRVTDFAIDPAIPINTSWDIGFDDSTAIWFWQLLPGEIRFVDYYENSHQDIEFYCTILKDRGYRYDKHFAPHDAAHKLFAAGGRSIVEQAMRLGVKMYSLPAATQQNSEAAARATLERSWFHKTNCEKGLEALRQYHYEWDEKTRTFKSTPLHDWSSHACDAFEICGQAWYVAPPKQEPPKPRFLDEITADEIFWPPKGVPGTSKQERI